MLVAGKSICHALPWDACGEGGDARGVQDCVLHEKQGSTGGSPSEGASCDENKGTGNFVPKVIGFGHLSSISLDLP